MKLLNVPSFSIVYMLKMDNITGEPAAFVLIISNFHYYYYYYDK